MYPKLYVPNGNDHYHSLQNNFIYKHILSLLKNVLCANKLKIIKIFSLKTNKNF